MSTDVSHTGPQLKKIQHFPRPAFRDVVSSILANKSSYKLIKESDKYADLSSHYVGDFSNKNFDRSASQNSSKGRGEDEPHDPLRALADLRHEFGEHGGVNMSMEASTTFTVMEPETMGLMFTGKLGANMDYFIYSRHFNPNVMHLSKQLAAMEGTEAAYCFASGMAAISSTIMQLCSSGDHVVASRLLYGGTFALFSHFLPRAANIQSTLVDPLDLEGVEAAIIPGKTKVIYAEAFSNPTLRVADIPGLSQIAKKHRLKLVIDNTFAPMSVAPAKLGADVVIHSISKFINGNSDHIAGAICGSYELIYQMMDLCNGTLMLLGPTMDASIAHTISMRMPHLGLRMKEHCHRAMEFAKRLDALGLKVIYPGLESHPQHKVAAKIVNKEFGYGGVFGLDLETTKLAYEFMRYLQNATQFGFMAVSLGFHETLMSCSGASTSSELTEEEKQKSGISPGLVRISIGYTGTLEQRWEQLYDALITLGLINKAK